MCGTLFSFFPLVQLTQRVGFSGVEKNFNGTNSNFVPRAVCGIKIQFDEFHESIIDHGCITCIGAFELNELSVLTIMKDQFLRGNLKEMFSIRKALIVLFFFFSGTSSCQSLFTSSNLRSASRHKEKASNSHNKAMSIDSASLVDPATAVVVATASSSTSIIAKLLGYVMGIGSMSVYTPIIINLLKAKSADGYSIQVIFLTFLYTIL